MQDTKRDIKNEQIGDWDVIPMTGGVHDDIFGMDVMDQGTIEMDEMQEDPNYLETLERENIRLRNALMFATNECNVLNDENNTLSNMIEERRNTNKGETGVFDVLPSVLEQSGAFDSDLQEEISRKEYVIQKKDNKATRLIEIIRGKNAEIDDLKQQLEDYKWRSWNINAYNVELERRLNESYYSSQPVSGWY